MFLPSTSPSQTQSEESLTPSSLSHSPSFLLDSIGSERFSFIQREDDTFLSLCLLPAAASCGQQPCAAVTSTVTKATKPLSDEFPVVEDPGDGARARGGRNQDYNSESAV